MIRLTSPNPVPYFRSLVVKSASKIRLRCFLGMLLPESRIRYLSGQLHYKVTA